MSLLVLTAGDIDQITRTFTPDELQRLMKDVFTIISASHLKGDVENSSPRSYIPPRISIPMPNHTALFMPARMVPGEGASIEGTTIKTVCVPKSSTAAKGLPASTLVLDEKTGAVKAIVNARNLTALRNAAGSLLSTRLVGPKAPKSIVAFGAGMQIEAHLGLFIRSYPTTIARCTIVNRSANERLQRLTNLLRARYPSVQFGAVVHDVGAATNDNTNHHERLGQSKSDSDSTVRDALLGAEIVVCATSSTAALFPSAWIRDGTHVILIGSYTPDMREVDAALVRRAAAAPHRPRRRPGDPILLVDSREACQKEAGELISAGIAQEEMVEIGEYTALWGSVDEVIDVDGSEIQGAGGTEGSITMFKSVGVGLQDVAIACATVRKAQELGIGTIIIKYD